MPKFKVGDWVMDSHAVARITEIKDNYYYFEGKYISKAEWKKASISIAIADTNIVIRLMSNTDKLLYT